MNDKTTNPKPTANGNADPAFPATVSRVLQGMVIEAPCKFKPGQKLTHDEAIFCSNAHLAAARSAYEDRAKSNLDENRTVGDPPKKVGPMTDAEFQADWRGYYDAYVWSPRGDSVILDPVEAEIRKIGRSELELALKQKKRTLVGLSKEDRETALQKYIAKYRPRLEKTAKANIAAATANVSEDFLAEIGATATKAAGAAETASQAT